MTSDAAPPFIRLGPDEPNSPVVVSVPHAGRNYGPQLLGGSRLPQSALELLEDRLADRLVWRATEAGVVTFVAQAPRAEIDLNREERELDPAIIAPPLPPAHVVQSARIRGGIGLIPTRITGFGAIWRSPIPRDELTRRITQIHRPYHAAIDAALRAARARFGAAVLLDCHSMPPRPDGEPPIVFGDRHGTAAAPGLLDAAVSAAAVLGYRSALNDPYAGGHVVARHGRPDRNIHALQIEIDRSAYLDTELRAPGPGFAAICRLVAAVAEALEARILGTAQPLAAE
ncbi:N-formylglutamate amidohydrolase [Sphingosinicella sp. LHD-64]|uniref:N-formylglutamate amidohydrolase n=1 Tax=Sphingosinicella sp. LHD-64 TaxID=3072139 RepID=UPI00280CFF3D|nr:N-formylglutamate amidohydrolase [Sphingosinicella sp. LHD-64]MDQ8755923.1 N-formylglutamate amidohydrolase [Sphingosinicella sp. LHD-64]